MTRIGTTTYMVSWFDPDNDEPVTDQFSNKEGRDGWAEDLRSRGIEVETWEQSWV